MFIVIFTALHYLLCYLLLDFIHYLVLCFVFFFFFKQKTSYDMRFSDWSSDGCSSDLAAVDRKGQRVIVGVARRRLIGGRSVFGDAGGLEGGESGRGVRGRRVAVSATAFPATAGGEQQGDEGKGDDEAHPHGQQPFAIEPTPGPNLPFAERLRKSGDFTPCRGGDQAVSSTFSKSSSFPSASRAIRLSVDRLTSRPFAPSPVSSSMVNATRVRSGASGPAEHTSELPSLMRISYAVFC